MKGQIILITAIGVLIGCSPKITSRTKNDFQQIRIELQETIKDSSSFGNEYPNYQISERQLLKSEANTLREKAAIKLNQYEATDVILNEDGSCGIIQINKITPNAKMRVSYIYLADALKSGEILADQILEEYKRGESFSNLAEKYSKDGNSKNGGDLGWFDEANMIEDFTKAIREHQKGDVFKLKTNEYGWYVISKTYEFKERIEFTITEIKKDTCG